jgi:hypothetical protein
MNIRLIVVAQNNRLSRAIYAADELKRFEVIRFRTLQNVVERENATGLFLVQWMVGEIQTELTRNSSNSWRQCFSRMIVYCPELSQKTVTESEEIRFALYQLGVVTVFSQLRELPAILSIIHRYAKRFPPPPKEWTQTVYESLPWKKAKIVDKTM